MFPKIRISELENDVELKKNRFEKSRDTVLDTARTELHPISLIKKHKKSALGLLLGLVAFGKFFGKINRSLGPRLKKSALWTMANAGLIWKVLDMSSHLLKLIGPKKNSGNRS